MTPCAYCRRAATLEVGTQREAWHVCRWHLFTCRRMIQLLHGGHSDGWYLNDNS